MTTHLYEAGDVICPVDAGDDPQERCEYLLLEGTAVLDEPSGCRPFPPGSGFGEAVMLGLGQCYPGKLRAEGSCTVKRLVRKDFDESLREFPADAKPIENLRAEVPACGIQQLQKRLGHSTKFRSVAPNFLTAVCQTVDLVLFAPGSAICTSGETCALGETPFYLVLGGRVRVESPLGTIFESIRAGEAFGEWASFGFVSVRSATVRANEGDLVCCLRIQGTACAKALKSHPDVLRHLDESYQRQKPAEQQKEESRREWLKDMAIPALECTPLLAGCPTDFLETLSKSLYERAYPAGSVITLVGEPMTAMLVVVRGEADMFAKNGTKVGHLVRGSAVGEVSALGLFQASMATVKALTSCRVLVVTEAALQRALQAPEYEGLADGFHSLISSRREQVARGMPMISLRLGTTGVDDVGFRGIALLSERISVKEGEVWHPVPDDDARGPCFTVLGRGRCVVEMGHERYCVMTLSAGSMIPDGLVANYNSMLRADLDCQAYRVKRSDFLTVVRSTASTKEWIGRFELMEKDVYRNFEMRLNSIFGLLEGGAPHYKDHEIEAWLRHFKQRVDKAKNKDKLPPVLSKRSLASSVAGSSMASVNTSLSGFGMSQASAGSLGGTLSAYPAGRLPFLVPKGNTKGKTLPLAGSRSQPVLVKTSS